MMTNVPSGLMVGSKMACSANPLVTGNFMNQPYWFELEQALELGVVESGEAGQQTGVLLTWRMVKPLALLVVNVCSCREPKATGSGPERI